MYKPLSNNLYDLTYIAMKNRPNKLPSEKEQISKRIKELTKDLDGEDLGVVDKAFRYIVGMNQRDLIRRSKRNSTNEYDMSKVLIVNRKRLCIIKRKLISKHIRNNYNFSTNQLRDIINEIHTLLLGVSLKELAETESQNKNYEFIR